MRTICAQQELPGRFSVWRLCCLVHADIPYVVVFYYLDKVFVLWVQVQLIHSIDFIYLGSVSLSLMS